jgi:hypothetical protein
MAIIQQGAFGYLFNACSSHHPQKADFYRQAALQGGFDIPEFVDELKQWKVVDGVNLTSVLDYTFVISNWGNSTF